MASREDIKDFVQFADIRGVVLFSTENGDEISDTHLDELLDDWVESAIEDH